MNLFGCKFCFKQDGGFVQSDRKNLDSLLWALVAVFEVCYSLSLSLSYYSIPRRLLAIIASSIPSVSSCCLSCRSCRVTDPSTRASLAAEGILISHPFSRGDRERERDCREAKYIH